MFAARGVRICLRRISVYHFAWTHNPANRWTRESLAFTAFIARWMTHRRAPFMLGVVAIAVSLPSLWTGLVVDDYVHRAMLLRLPGFTTRPLDMFSFLRGGADRADAVRRLAFPWWSAPDLKLAFWRPLSAVTHVVDYALWPDAPWLMHLHSVLWYAAVVVVVSVLFRQLMGVGWVGGLAGFAYAVSQTHAVPVFFIANRNALLGVFFGVVTLLLHHRWRRLGKREAAVLAPLALLLGLFSSEGAIAACAYVFAYALFIDTSTLRARASSLAPYVVIVVSWRLAYQLQGYGAAASAAYIDPGASPAAFLGAVVTREPIYLLSQWLFPPADWSRLVSSATLMKWWLFAMGFFVVLCLVLFPLLKRDCTARFWFTGMMLSLVPSCATFPSDRMLLHSGIGGAALLSQFAVAAYTGQLVPPTARIRKLAARALFDGLIALHVVWSPAWLPIQILATAGAMHNMTDGVEALAQRDDLSHKLVVLVDDVLWTGGYFPALRALSGHDPVEQLLLLAPVEDRFDPVVLSRTSADTLVMEVGGTYEWFLERDRAHPFMRGDSIRVNRVTVEILQVTGDGRPTKVAFHFDTALEDDSIAWFARLEPSSASAFPLKGRYPPWQPPPIGQTTSAR